MTENKSQTKNQNEAIIQDLLLDMDIQNSTLASDGVYVYPEYVSILHAIIYDWVFDVYGEDAACNPCWNIPALAKHIHDNFCRSYEQKYCVSYRKENQCVKSINTLEKKGE